MFSRDSFSDVWRRLPRSNRSFLAYGLIALSFIAAVGLTQAANKTVTVWGSTTSLNPGEKIRESDLRKIKVLLPENAGRYLSTSSSLKGATVLRAIGSGELIPLTSVTRDSTEISTRSVPIKVGRNDLPADLMAGSVVDIYALPSQQSSSQSNDANNSVGEIAHSVRVESIDNKSRDLGGDIGIVIRLSKESVLDFLAAIPQSRLVVVRSAF